MTADSIDLQNPTSVHIVGIGGSGMSAIAEVLVGLGHSVSGSDLSESVVTERLRERGVTVTIGHDAGNIGAVELVTHSSAIKDCNPELVEAEKRGIAILKRSETLAALTRVWETIAVAGTHGKTTTSAMLTVSMRDSGLEPTYIVGGDLRDLDRGAAVGDGEFLVVEADESDGTFIELQTKAVIVTNIEADHLEHYGGLEGLEQAFVRFVSQADGPKVLCSDDPGVAQLLERISQTEGIVTYGTTDEAMWRIVGQVATERGIAFKVVGPTESVDVKLSQPGLYNAMNATAAMVMAHLLGADISVVAESLSRFGGVGRRFENRGQVRDVAFYDDYAHLPTEVLSVLKAARSLEPNRLVVAFQPHRYSRTEQLWPSFRDCFAEADVLFITGIYSAGEKPRADIDGSLIANLVAEAYPNQDVRYVESLSELVDAMVAELQAGDLCITLGAGDLTEIPDRLIQGLTLDKHLDK